MITLRLARLGILILAMLVLPTALGAQPQGKVVRIGLLDFGASNPSSDARWKALRERLRELGYVEGQNVVFESRWGNAQVDRLPGLATELVNLKVDIVVTATGEAALAAKRATSSIPIVIATTPDPVRLGLVASLARPGGNVTGVISLSSDLTGKRLELLKQLLPRAARVAVLNDPDNRSSEFIMRDAESVAKSLGVVVQGVDARGQAEFDAAFSAMKRARRRRHPRREHALHRPPSASRGARRLAPAADDGRGTGVRRGRGSSQLWHRLPRSIPSCRHIRRQDPQRRQARRFAYRAAHHVRAGDQSQDRQGPRTDYSAIGTRPSG